MGSRIKPVLNPGVSSVGFHKDYWSVGNQLNAFALWSIFKMGCVHGMPTPRFLTQF